MPIKDLCSNTIISISKNASLREAATLMQQSNIGAIVAVDNKDQYPIPCGILTDRDIVTHVLTQDRDLQLVKISDIMSKDLFLANHKQGLKEVIQEMTAKKIRRAPIVDDDGKLVGMVSTDDLFVLLADELKSLAELIQGQING